MENSEENASKKAKSCNCNFEDDVGADCEYCGKWCSNISHYVMHVSQSKACLENHDPEVFKEYKRRSRMLTKKKWYHARAHGKYSEEFKEERKQRQKNSKKIYYVPNNIKFSPSGRAFEKLFKPIYTKYLDEAESMIETLSHGQKALTNKAIDEALDHVFNETPKCDCYGKRYLLIDENYDDTKILELAFEKLEKKFNEKFAELVADKRNGWRAEKFVGVSSNLYSFAKNKAFVECYGEQFKGLFEKAVDNALDVVMMDLITTEAYFDDEKDLEEQMDWAYKSVLVTEVKKLYDKDENLNNELTRLMENILRKKFFANDIKYDRI